MACEIVGNQGDLITVKVSGKLKWAEFAQAERTASAIMRSGRKVRFLILAENFQGWDTQGAWGDLDFQLRHDKQIERIALVGEKHWQELTEVFVGKGLRPVDIRYFTPSQEVLARAWVTQTNPAQAK